jgi:steroid delta-isomerase-like uncharacterized protein
MTSDANNQLNRQWIQAFNERDWTKEAACRSANFQAHVSGAPSPLDASGWAGFLQSFTTAFPDARIDIGASISEGEQVATRWTIYGTHRGEFQGVPPSGQQIVLPGVDFSLVVDDKIAEHWAQFDIMGLMQQIGAMPQSTAQR